jgi:Kef-type K+ transport system membrane component KefB
MARDHFTLKNLLVSVTCMSAGFAGIVYAARHEFVLPLSQSYDRVWDTAPLARTTLQVLSYVCICAGLAQLLKRLRFVVVLMLMIAGSLAGAVCGALIEHALIPDHHYFQQTYDDRSAEPGVLQISCLMIGAFGTPLLAAMLLRLSNRTPRD